MTREEEAATDKALDETLHPWKRVERLEAEIERLKSGGFTYEHQHEITGLTAERDWEQARAERLEKALRVAREHMRHSRNCLNYHQDGCICGTDEALAEIRQILGEDK